MNSIDPSFRRTATSLATGFLRVVWRVLRAILYFMVCAWTALAFFYSNLPWMWLRALLAVAFAGFAIWALCMDRRQKMRLLVAGLFLVALVWFFLIPPSLNRDWRPEVAVMPRAYIEGDRVILTGVRDFNYRTRDDFDVHYVDRDVSLSDLKSVDFFISYWAFGPVGHTFVSFNFENAEPVCISIETRPEKGESYDPLASVFRGFELIYVVGEERDLVASRSNHRGEKVFLYPLRVPPSAARRLFLEYLERINYLADNAEWYHLLSNNCTLNIIRYANAAGREGRFDIRHLFNGLIDSYLYETGMIGNSLPFTEFREQSLINDEAMEAEHALDFSAAIRRNLPGSRGESQSPP